MAVFIREESVAYRLSYSPLNPPSNPINPASNDLLTSAVSKSVNPTTNPTKRIMIRLNGTGKYTVHPKGCGLVANKPLLLLVMVV